MNARIAAPSMNTRTVALSVAGVLALGTGLMTYNYLASVGRPAAAPETTRAVLVAAREIPAHTLITPEMLARVARPVSAVDPDAVDRVADLRAAEAANAIPAGSVITRSKLAHANTNGILAHIRPGMRAVAVALDRVKGVSDLLQPGDTVDVIAVTAPRGRLAPVAATIVRGARVLSVGANTDQSATPAPDMQQHATATLELTPAQAATVSLADINATIRLALRAPRDGRAGSGDALDLSVPEPRLAPAVAPAAPAPPPAARPTTPPKPRAAVAIIDGDHVVQ